MRPVPVGLDPILTAFLKELRGAVADLQRPGQPQLAYAIASTSLPQAESWKTCVVELTDKNCLALSTNVAGTWTWLRADGSAI